MLSGSANGSVRLLVPAHSSLRTFASRLQSLGGDAVTLGGGEKVGVDLVRERDAALAVHGHPLVRAVSWHRDTLETGGWRPLSRLLFLLVHAREELGHGHKGLDGDRREHVPDALGLWVVVHAGHLRPELRPGQDARQYVEHDGQARTLRAAQWQDAPLEGLLRVGGWQTFARDRPSLGYGVVVLGGQNYLAARLVARCHVQNDRA